MSRSSQNKLLEQDPEWSVLEARDIIEKYERGAKYSDVSENFSRISKEDKSRPSRENTNAPMNGMRPPMGYQQKLVLDESPGQLNLVQPVISSSNFVYTIPLVHYPSTYINHVQPYFLYPSDQSVMYMRYPSFRPSSAEIGKVVHKQVKPDPPRTPIPQRRQLVSRKETNQHIHDVTNDSRRFEDTDQRSRDRHYQPIRFYHKTGQSLDNENMIPSHENHHSLVETFDTNARNSRLGSGRLISALNKVNQAAVNLQKMSLDLNKNVNSILETN